MGASVRRLALLTIGLVALACGPGAPTVATAGANGGSGVAWQLFGPGDYRGDTLSADFATLGAEERLAVLLLNPAGDDPVAARLDAAGTEEPMVVAPSRRDLPDPGATEPASAHDRSRGLQEDELRALLRGPREPPNRPAKAAPESFCTVRGLDWGRRVRKPAVLEWTTGHAVFYADAEDAAHYDASFFPALGEAWERTIYPRVTAAFGAESDVDGNGKLLVFFTHELGVHAGAGWLIGYFGGADLLRARDDSPDCSGGGSNGADMFFLNDVANAEANGYPSDQARDEVFPETLAHELQHLINLNQRCLLRSCGGPEETWLNEGLSKLAEDEAGFGWTRGRGRGEGARFLVHSDRVAQGAPGMLGYDGRSLTRWEGDPIGNYQGVHAFLRYLADREGPSLARKLVATQAAGQENLEAAVGTPLVVALAEWTSALLLAGDPIAGAAASRASAASRFSSQLGYSGPDWSPLEERVGRLEPLPLGRSGAVVELRTDGFTALATGTGTGGAARLTIHSGKRPWAVVLRIPSHWAPPPLH